ncbi:hypothetical protein DDB_G0275641 [Dictyostelium discoideum AX4]|uniref:Uncharacterized protein n=1 Tax=Dictyostelium discoideum TaxID=44689 RepID=Q86IA6_DICDI|nr:hypothetical protein DDB_G0275641 [Dictyostelium discoideum AX4]EAL69571.1 hypothetical protein DDB_G0275641 [Dictyostelium discoideum AX4]|eukprot:XP_643627.1 hypothetical protein DDB_G0275641 [Dictyostelium discoideum AX4]
MLSKSIISFSLKISNDNNPISNTITQNVSFDKNTISMRSKSAFYTRPNFINY